MMIYKSLDFDQFTIMDSIRALHAPEGFDVDVTFGNGGLYRNEHEWPRLRFDKDDSLPHCEYADSCHLPLGDSSVDSLVFDPPFLTYIRSGRDGNGNMALAKRFSGYWRYDELEQHYRDSLKEFARVLKKKGIVVFKCQDIVHNHRLHPTHINIVSWAEEWEFRLKDLFVLGAKHRMPAPNRNGKPKHARIFHS